MRHRTNGSDDHEQIDDASHRPERSGRAPNISSQFAVRQTQLPVDRPMSEMKDLSDARSPDENEEVQLTTVVKARLPSKMLKKYLKNTLGRRDHSFKLDSSK